MPQSDNEIIERIRDGAKHHYAQLVDRYKDRAFTLAVRMLKNKEDAEEAAQDAFIRAYNALNRFEGKARFGTWFYRILYNVCLTRLGKRKEEFQRLDYDDDIDYNGFESAFTASGYNEYETNDMVEFVKKTMEALPEKYQTILSLFYFQDLSHEEISDVTQLPIGTIKTHLFRARAILQQLLQSAEGGQLERVV
jgi:RNA polymerase sigma-70 factor (ECF subfamily)